MRFTSIVIAFAVFALLAAGCTAGNSDSSDGDNDGSGGAGSGTNSGPSGPGGTTGTGFEVTSSTSGSGGGSADGCVENAKLIYVVSVENTLYSFDPKIPGTAAYKEVGTLSCPSSGSSSPQSMSVDHNGVAWVFYDSGQMFQVSTLDASCQATSYVHPVQNGFNQLGMGFTATSDGSKDDQLFVVSPDFGLATVAFPSMAVTKLNVLQNAAELTGGPDAKLFEFVASSAKVNEIDIANGYSTSQVHTFSELSGTNAWAFSRYGGKFYLFTSPGTGFSSKTTEYDPVTNTSSVRDASIGFTIVGAGQSICVPAPPPQ